MNQWAVIQGVLKIEEEHQVQANSLIEEWEQKGYIHKTCKEMLGISDEAIVLFYEALGRKKKSGSRVSQCENSSWMLESDFCFINVRATGKEESFGNFITAAKLLPIIRANAIHLGPFTSYDFGTIYAITSTKTISKNVVNIDLWHKGITPEQQLQGFVEACHLLGKTVGFDIEPHVAQFAITVLENPQLFRWIHLGDNKELAGELSQQEQLTESYQKGIQESVKSLVAQRLNENGFKTLESEENDTLTIYNQKESLYFSLIGEVIQLGFWTIPSHTWGGVGIPAFAGYHRQHNYAQFLYLDCNGNNQNDAAYDIVTPYKFSSIQAVNSVPTGREEQEMNQESIEYYSDIFPYFRDKFGFDFVRYDSLDHIFDSVQEDGSPRADRPTPEILRYVIRKSKQNGKAFIGNLAERMGNEYADYGSLGFDLLLGNEAMEQFTSNFVYRTIQLNEQLSVVNQDKANTSICFALDTHDTGSGHMWGQPLTYLAGFDGMRLRHLIARFLPVGKSYRTKYEVMGVQDLSYGLFESNISNQNLVWQGDQWFNKVYHYIEDRYEENKELLKHGRIIKYGTEKNYSWWMIQYGKKILIPVVGTEQGGDTSYFSIPLPSLCGDIAQSRVHDFYKCEVFPLYDVAHEIHIHDFRYRQCLLYEVEYK